MQPGEKIVSPGRRRNKQPVKAHHLSSFGILNRNGLEIINEMEPPVIEEEAVESNKLSQFSDWSMPEEKPGYIKCKAHDFF